VDSRSARSIAIRPTCMAFKCPGSSPDRSIEPCLQRPHVADRAAVGLRIKNMLTRPCPSSARQVRQVRRQTCRHAAELERAASDPTRFHLRVKGEIPERQAATGEREARQNRNRVSPLYHAKRLSRPVIAEPDRGDGRGIAPARHAGRLFPVLGLAAWLSQRRQHSARARCGTLFLCC
jgi:hypothetical protein